MLASLGANGNNVHPISDPHSKYAQPQIKVVKISTHTYLYLAHAYVGEYAPLPFSWPLHSAFPVCFCGAPYNVIPIS